MTDTPAKAPALAIDYVEFSSPEPTASTAFFARAFGWGSVDYGPDYQEVSGAGLGAGVARGATIAPLVILKTDALEAAQERVIAAGGEITKEIFAFPGGRRFEFREPGGTVLAVWSEA